MTDNITPSLTRAIDDFTEKAHAFIARHPLFKALETLAEQVNSIDPERLGLKIKEIDFETARVSLKLVDLKQNGRTILTADNNNNLIFYSYADCGRFRMSHDQKVIDIVEHLKRHLPDNVSEALAKTHHQENIDTASPKCKQP